MDNPPSDVDPVFSRDGTRSGSMLLRVSQDDIVMYANHALARYMRIDKQKLIGSPLEVVRSFMRGEIAECIARPERGRTANRLATDPEGRVFEVKMYSDGGVLDIVIDDVTDLETITNPLREHTNLPSDTWGEEELRVLRQPERRYITVSHTRLWNLGSLSAMASPAELRMMMSAFIEEISDAIVENSSTSCVESAETVQGIYGAPRYFLDHGIRAMKSAGDQMRKLEELRSAFSKQGHELPPAGIGIVSGEAVLATIGVTGKQEFSAVGMPVSIAARLSALARPNEILLTEETLHAALNCLPPGWQSVRAESEEEPDFTDLRYDGAEIIPLPQEMRKGVFLLGPGVEDNTDLTEFFIRYLYSVKFPEEERPVVILSLVRPQSSGSSVELDDENVVMSHSLRTLGKYRLVETIGKGGMGQVWRGQDRFGNSVAIKILNAGDGASDTQLRRFKREAEVMAKLPHRNICRIYEIGEFEGVTYISMEFVEGISLADLLYGKVQDESVSTASTDISSLIRTLRSERSQSHEAEAEPVEVEESPPRIKDNRILPIQQTLHIVGRICDAVQFAHEHGVLHRDLKPGNILLREDGEPLVADFGLAKMEGADATHSLSVSGHVVGTIENMAPEQAVSSKDVDERADVYAIGTILYQMLTGRRYFETTGNLLMDAQAIQRHVPVRPRVYNRQIDSDLEVITLKALRTERGERYRNVSALKADLDHYLHGEIISAKPVTVWALTQKAILRNKAMAGVIAASVVALISTGVFFVIQISSKNTVLRNALEEAKVSRDSAEKNSREAQEQTQIAQEKEKLAEENKKKAEENEALAQSRELQATAARQQLEAEQLAKAVAQSEAKAAGEQSERLKEERNQKEVELEATQRQIERLRAVRQEERAAPRSPQEDPVLITLWEQARNAYTEPFLAKNLSSRRPSEILDQINHCMDIVSQILIRNPAFAPAWYMKLRLHLACMELDEAETMLDKMKNFIPPDAPLPPGENADMLSETIQTLKKANRDMFQTGAQLLNNDTGIYSYTTRQLMRYFQEHQDFRPGGRLSGTPLNRPVSPVEVMLLLALNAKGHPPQPRIIPDSSHPGFYQVEINDGENVDSLAPLKKLKISSLSLHDSPQVDWQTIEQLSLEKLDLSGSHVEQIPLVPHSSTGYARLRQINLANTGITQIGALSGMPLLEDVDISQDPVTDISPLRGKRLKSVNVSETSVADISPIAQNYLKVLDISKSGVSSLAALRLVPLETLILSPELLHDPQSLALLKSSKTIKALRTPNDPLGQSVSDFWKKNSQIP